LGRSGGDIYKSTTIADCKEGNRAPAGSQKIRSRFDSLFFCMLLGARTQTVASPFGGGREGIFTKALRLPTARRAIEPQQDHKKVRSQ